MGPPRSLVESLLWRAALLSMVTCVVVVKMGADDVVGQLFGVAGVIAFTVAYQRARDAPRAGRDSAPKDALTRTIRMGVLNRIEPPARRRSA